MRLSDKYPFLTNYFTQALTVSDRAFPQSIVFYGGDFNAQYELSKEIARFLNCKNDRSDDCECLNCRWINEWKHPAVMTISKVDNKPEGDGAKTVISIEQSRMIKEMLVSASEFHRVFIFCDRDENDNICGLNQTNFQAETANSMLKLIEEPQSGVTFIFLTRYPDDLLPTIISRSQLFFVPLKEEQNYDFSIIDGIFTDYYNFERKDIFDISQKLLDLTSQYGIESVLQSIQNYILAILKNNPQRTDLIEHIRIVETSKREAKLGMKPINVLDDLCLKIIH